MSLSRTLSKLFSKTTSSNQMGLCIGQASVSFSVQNEQNQINCLDVPLPINLSQSLKVEDATQAVVDMLQQIEKDQNVSGNCNLILPTSHYQIVQIDKPNVPDAEISAALKWQVKDQVSIPVDDMIVDYFDGPTLGSSPKLNVVCASKSFLSSIVHTLDDSDVLLKIISTEEFAFARLLPKLDDAVLLVCQQPNQEIVLMIVLQGKLYFHRRLRGFAQISQQSPEQLSSFTVDSLSLEIQRSTDYFERQLKQAPIKSIKVIVPIENEQVLVDALSQNTHIPVELLILPEGVENKRQFAAAYGASMLNVSRKQ